MRQARPSRRRSVRCGARRFSERARRARRRPHGLTFYEHINHPTVPRNGCPAPGKGCLNACPGDGTIFMAAVP